MHGLLKESFRCSSWSFPSGVVDAKYGGGYGIMESPAMFVPGESVSRSTCSRLSAQMTGNIYSDSIAYENGVHEGSRSGALDDLSRSLAKAVVLEARIKLLSSQHLHIRGALE